jgi:hypothetical protein
VVEGNGLNRRSPSDAIQRNWAIGLANGKAKGEVAVVIAEATGILRIRAIEEADLAEHWIPIDKHFVPDPQIIIAKPPSARDVNKKVAMPKPLAGHFFACTIKLPVSPVTVDPGIS